MNGHDVYELYTALSSKPTMEDLISILDRLSIVINVM